MNFKISGVGMYAPEKIVTNDDLTEFLDTSDEWISKRVGVRQRHISTDETTSEMGYRAACSALENSGCDASDIDLIIAATVSGEVMSPAIACIIQQKLGATCPAFDINSACSSFIFMLEIAAGFFARKTVKKVLLVGAERLSRVVDWTDRSTCVIMGDGAGAVVLSEGDGYLSSILATKGDDTTIRIPQFIGNSPFYTLEPESPFMSMNGQKTFMFAVNAICSDVETLLAKENLTIDDISYIVPHQANKRIIDFAAERLGIPKEKFFTNIERYGNTSAASIPIALDEMNRSGLVKPGDLLLLTAFGGGLSNASCILKW